MAGRIKQSIENNTLYWTLQITGWSLFLIVFSAFAMVMYEFSWRVVVNYFYVAFVGLVLSHAYRGYVKKREWQKLRLRKLAIRIIVAPVILALIWEALFLPISILLSTNEEQLTPQYIFMLTFNLSMIFFMWNLIYFFYKLFTSYRQSEIEKWKLMAAVKDAQLIALKSQINPHFMFNSLNNIRSLVVEKP